VSTDPQATRPLPDRPSLRHLKDQAKDLLKAGTARSLAAAQYQIARLYGFASWPKLKAFVESLGEAGELKLAIDRNDLERVKAMMTRHPALHRAPLGYGKDGPLTWVAECRVPLEPPGPVRLEMAKWMIDHGSDVHQGGDGPLMRAALQERVPMMDLLLAHGANVNAEWHGEYPIIYSACEAVDPVSLTWLLDHGANPNCDTLTRPYPDTALDYVIGSYARSPQLRACIDVLAAAGCRTRCPPAVLDVLRGDVDAVSRRLDADPALTHERFPSLDFGTTGARSLTLRGTTLLHVAAEYLNVELAALLLARGADVNARATLADAGVGGQTPIFHAATQFWDEGLPIVRLLVERGADVNVRAKLPGHYERPDEVVECTPLSYALLFQADSHSEGQTIAFLREHGASIG
jgi:ankyrin repeat protein